MPQIRFTPTALHDLERLREFLRPKNPAAAKRAAQGILKSVQILRYQPHMGRPIADMSDEFREWLIEFGDSGYVARYHYDRDECITVLSIRHQKEAGL